MNLPTGWLALAAWMAGLAAASVATWLLCRWWYGRKLKAAAQRLHKSDQGRLHSQQQTMQARRQLEALRAELAELRKSSLDTQAQRQRRRELETALIEAEQSVEADPMPLPRQASGSHGFADTQILP